MNNIFFCWNRKNDWSSGKTYEHTQISTKWYKRNYHGMNNSLFYIRVPWNVDLTTNSNPMEIPYSIWTWYSMSNKHYSYFLKLLVFGLKAPSLKEFVRVTLFNQFDVNTQFSCVKKYWNAIQSTMDPILKLTPRFSWGIQTSISDTSR